MIEQITSFVTTLMAGGTLEIVLLIVLVIVALIIFLVALFVLWKLLGLFAKGLLWIIGFGSNQFQSRSAAHKEAQRGKLPLVSTGWGLTDRRISLRRALAQANRIISSDATRIVVVAGESGAGDLCRSLGLDVPSAASFGIAAGGDTLLIDATRASRTQLRKLARALPWRRPVDGVAVLAKADGLPVDGIAAAADFARAAGMQVALHIVLPSRNPLPAWRIIDASNKDASGLCSQLAADAMRIWLIGGEREGLQQLALAQSRDLPNAIDRALAVAPSSLVDVASLGFSGAGLRGAVSQTIARTRPVTRASTFDAVAYGIFAIAIALLIWTVTVKWEQSQELRGAVSIAEREATVPWVADSVDAIPNNRKMHRLTVIAQRLANMTDFSLLSPIAFLTPNFDAPRRLGAALLDSYMLRPLGDTLNRQAENRLIPTSNAESWLTNARVIGDWIAAWEALDSNPQEVDMKALLAAAFGGSRDEWPDEVDLALVNTAVDIPLPQEGGFDVDLVTDLARENFDQSMRLWAHEKYTNGPVARAARRASDPSLGWREHRAALIELRSALQDPGQQWLISAEDRSDHTPELRLLGVALAQGLIGQVTTIEAKAGIARIRIDARNQIGQYSLPGLGPLLNRTMQGSGSNLQLTPTAAAWLRYLDKIANAGFPELPPIAANTLTSDVVTIDVAEVAKSAERLRAYNRFSSDLTDDLPTPLVRSLLSELASELVLGITIEVENALRVDNDLGIARVRAERRANAAAAALIYLDEIEAWLVAQNERSQALFIAKIRARLADGVLEAASDVLIDEDPLAVPIDPTSDANAIVRRFERGLMRLRTLTEQFARPFLDAATSGGDSFITLQWNNIADDFASYERGDADSILSALEGSIRAWAEDVDNACVAPKTPPRRGIYLASAVDKFRMELVQACDSMRRADLDNRMQQVLEYYDMHIKGLWPFAVSEAEVGPAAFSQFIDKLHEQSEVFPLIEGQLASTFLDHANFWDREEEGATVNFSVDWRWRRDVEKLAEHIAEVRLEGVQKDEAGNFTWRYGEPFAIYVRLAKNSRYHFRTENSTTMREWRIAPEGFGAKLRAFKGLQNGEFLLNIPLIDSFLEDEQTLRMSVRVLHADGRPMTLP
ncbi:MAG: hypothetical protein OXC62_00575 [Aestuariivita sp.]|nr:hypothetical protein [Aestuariivita sp.]